MSREHIGECPQGGCPGAGVQYLLTVEGSAGDERAWVVAEMSHLLTPSCVQNSKIFPKSDVPFVPHI